MINDFSQNNMMRAIEPDDAPIYYSPITHNTDFVQGYLNNKLNQYAIVDFLHGTYNLERYQGIIKEVGADFIVLHNASSNSDIVGDIYSIKFINFPEYIDQHSQGGNNVQ